MAVLCLMYHHTPVGRSENPWDVQLDEFRASVKMMIDVGVQFIDLSRAKDPDKLAHGMHVVMTFDDGHTSNVAAFEFLAQHAIRPTAFIVKDWSQQRSEYMKPQTIADLMPVCDFGSHGTSHTGLTLLSDVKLKEELHASRAFLEDLLRTPIIALALPGGVFNARVLQAAAAEGYHLVANSIEDLTTAVGPNINRPCISSMSGVSAPWRYATAGLAFWLRKRMRRHASGLSTRLFGEAGHERLARVAKTLLRPSRFH